MTILDQIIKTKKIELKLSKFNNSIIELEKFPIFERTTVSLSKNIKNSFHGIIAEHKRKSPSKSIINDTISINEVIKGYDFAEVCGISVLTDNKYFKGSLDDLLIARNVTNIPILRKEFIIDEYQIIEAKAYGADAILLIASCLSDKKIKNLSECAKKIGLEVLIEIHNLEELNGCLIDSIDIIGVNNRNLKTFKVDIQTSKNLIKYITSDFIKISESGLSSPIQLKELKKFGFDGFLIGENFMKHTDPGLEALKFINKLK